MRNSSPLFRWVALSGLAAMAAALGPVGGYALGPVGG
jgi:hypothetical protein